MNDNQTPKKSLSKQLNEVFEHMEEIDISFKKIEVYIEQEYGRIERSINPEQNNDISKELKYYLANFLKQNSLKYDNSKFTNPLK